MRVAFNQLHGLNDAERIAVLDSGNTVKGPQHNMRVAGPTLTAVEKELQAATLARDWPAMFTKNGAYYQWPKKAPLGKYSFVDQNGARNYVPFTAEEIRSFGYSPYARIKKGFKCGDKRRNEIIKTKVKKAEKDARKYPASDPRHVRPIFPGILFCKPEDNNDLLKKVAIAAAVVTGGIMLGPAIMAGAAKAGGAAMAAGGKIAAAAAKVLPLATQALNSKRTVDALKNGQLPPPPISLGDGSLTDYAQVVGQQILERDLGRGASDAEMQQLYAMIEQQRQLLAAQEQPHYPVVNSGLAPELTAAQKVRADTATSNTNLLKLAAIVLPLGFLLFRGTA